MKVESRENGHRNGLEEAKAENRCALHFRFFVISQVFQAFSDFQVLLRKTLRFTTEILKVLLRKPGLT